MAIGGERGGDDGDEPREPRHPLVIIVALQIIWMATVFGVWVVIRFYLSTQCGIGFGADSSCNDHTMRPITYGAFVVAGLPVVAYIVAAVADRRAERRG